MTTETDDATQAGADAPQREEPRKLSFRFLRIDGETQARSEIDQATVDEYAAAISAGATFPPIEVTFDGRHYWMVDGFHRYHALKSLGRSSCMAIIREGTQASARWLACGANQTHGLKRSNADKRRAVSLALAFKPDLSDGAIASHCGVDPKTVASVRAEMAQAVPAPPTRTGRDGRTINTKAIGRRAEAADEQPDAGDDASTTPGPLSGAEPGPFDGEEPGPFGGAEPAPDAPADLTLEDRIAEAEAECAALHGMIERALSQARDLAGKPAGTFLNLNAIEADLKNARSAVKYASPAGACPHCEGDGCEACRGQGWIGKLQAETMAKTNRKGGRRATR